MAYENLKAPVTSTNVCFKHILRITQLPANKCFKLQKKENILSNKTTTATQNVIELSNENYLPLQTATILKPLTSTPNVTLTSPSSSSCNETNLSCFCINKTKTNTSNYSSCSSCNTNTNYNYLYNLQATKTTTQTAETASLSSCLPKIRTAAVTATTANIVRELQTAIAATTTASTVSSIPSNITSCRSFHRNSSNNNYSNTFNFTSLRFIILVLYLILTSCVGVSLQLKNGKYNIFRFFCLCFFVFSFLFYPFIVFINIYKILLKVSFFEMSINIFG